jgi:hypothetical protein
MNNQELVTKFNPANAANLTPEDLAILRDLNDAQITVLAQAYPNQPTRRAYLILYDQNLPLNKQFYHLSTWQNLNNVRKFANRKNLIPWTFTALHSNTNKQAPTPSMTSKPAGPRVPVDLTANEAAAELEKSLQRKGSVTQPVINPPKGARAGQSSRKTINTTAAASGLDVHESPEDASDSVPDDQQFTAGE